MKTIDKLAAQGDVLFKEIEALPENATQQKDAGEIVIAHSETGHHHVIDASGVVRFEINDPLVCYLRIDAEYADVVHKRSFDTHETIRLLGGGKVYKIHRQREWSPEGWQRAAD